MKSKNKFKKILYVEKTNNNLYYIKYKICNIKKSMFVYKPNKGHYFKDTYVNDLYTVTFKINIETNNFDDLFKNTYDLLYIETLEKSFDILITSEPLPITKLNKNILYTISGNISPLTYTCQIKGIVPYQIRKTRKKHISHKKYSTSQKTTYNSSQWAVQHPYYGGGFTPR